MSSSPPPPPPPSSAPSESQYASFQSGANFNPSPGPSTHNNLRQRPLGRAATTTTFAESPSSKFRRRNSSALSDTVSEARQSIRDSTDDLLFPRARPPFGMVGGGGPQIRSRHHEHLDSHWQSAPLALALLPAVGGLFFQNGSAFVTDVTLLVLAAIFLNWSVRLPWNWYHSAQEIRQIPPETTIISAENDGTIAEEDENEDGEKEEKKESSDAISPKQQDQKVTDQSSQAAMKELHMHEIAALISCFVFPLIGAWLLHTIRGALSRPSEGLVSNYNLSIFILAAEIRPFAHLLRMVQGRTLYLQRVVATAVDEEDEEENKKFDHDKILDLAARLEALEAYIADKAATSTSEAVTNSNTAAVSEQPESSSASNIGQGQGQGQNSSVEPETVAQIAAEVRHTFQPELDALNRAVRRYEKKTAMMAFQTDSRLNQIESQVSDAIVLAAADRDRRGGGQGFVFALFDWLYAIIVIPVTWTVHLVSLPGRIVSFCLRKITACLPLPSRKRKRRVNSINNTKGKQAQIQRRPTTLSERRYAAS